MSKKGYLSVIILAALLGTLGSVQLFNPTHACSSLECEDDHEGVVKKLPGETFIVKIAFKNKGAVEGEWQVAVSFEGDCWEWQSEKKQLTLEPNEKEILEWEGYIPEDAQVDSVARLIVYYDNEFVALNWWIHIVGEAKLCIIQSNVR